MVSGFASVNENESEQREDLIMGTALRILFVGAQFVWRHRHEIVNAHRRFVKHDTDLEKVVDFIDSTPNNFRRKS